MVLVAPLMFVKVEPPSALACHWTAGVGLPDAAAVNVTELLSHTVLFVGLAVMTGGVLTVTVLLHMLLQPLASVIARLKINEPEAPASTLTD